MTNSAELRKRISDKGLKLGYVADQLGLTHYGLQLKLDNKNQFKASEISKLCEILEITSLADKERIFFAKEVDEKSTK